MRISVRHVTRLDYDALVTEGVMDLRLGPYSDAHQRWERFDLRVLPGASVRRYEDGFRNTSHLITLPRPHQYIEVVADSEIQTLLENPFEDTAAPGFELGPAETADYLTPSPLVPLTDGVRDLAEPFRPSGPEHAFAAVHELMALIYGRFAYQKDVTSVTTTVPEVLAAGAGVCQDFAHTLIALCKALDIPARYVSGYVAAEREAAAGDQATPRRGTAASHAWVEAFTPTHGWRGFDPTNNLLASAAHVKMAVGRDYSDVPPTRGTFRGRAAESLKVEVHTAVVGS